MTAATPAPVVVVTPNPAVDVTYRVDVQQLGETVRVRTVTRRPGGKGVNVARVLALAGVPALCILPLGGDAGRWFESAARGRGLEVRAVEIAGETRTTVAVVDDRHHPTLYAEPGPVLSPSEWAALGRTVERALVGASALVVSGSLPPGADPGVVGGWVRAARERGVPSVVDTSGDALRAAAAAGADVLKPNAAEAREATGAPDDDTAASALLSLGAGLVVVSRGTAGLLARSADEAVHVDAVPHLEGNPTGAGDAATAGLVRATLAGLGLEQRVRHAAAFGAAAVLSPVAGELDLTHVERFLARLEPDTGDVS